jgi:hypothetical protein
VDLAELDALFTRYRDAERRIGANLVELDADPTLKMLAAGQPRGETARLIGPAVASAPRLWVDYELLRGCLGAAEAARGTSRRPTDSGLAEFVRILTTSSVERAADDAPLADRTRLGSSPSTAPVTVEQLLASMTKTYDAVRDAVTTVEAVWSKAVPRLDAARSALGPLREQAAAIEVLAEPALDTLTKLIDDVERHLGDDPVAVSDASLGALDAALELARSRVADLLIAHDSFAADLERAREFQTSLTENLNAVRESYARATQKVVGAQGVADLADDDLAAYRLLRSEAVSMLDGVVDRGVHWRTRRLQLDSWMARANALDAKLRAAAFANLAPIARRDELRGLLTAFEAKAAARRRIERPAIIEQLRAARDLAGRVPCDVGELTAMLDALARDLSTKDM